VRYREEWLPHADWVELDGAVVVLKGVLSNPPESLRDLLEKR
jgi:hypothetical protein